MWLITDTNQTRAVPAHLQPGRVTSTAVGITLPPYILAEILLRGPGPRRDTLARLRAHRVRIGLEPIQVAETLATLSASEIPLFEPFPAPRSVLGVLYGQLLDEDGPVVTPAVALWAKTVKDSHRAFMGGIIGRSDLARKEARRRRVGRVRDFQEALGMAEGPDSFVGSLTSTIISNGKTRPVRVIDSARLYRAVMRNPYLRHFLHAILYYIVSISRLWTDQRLNRDPLSDRDDWTDLIVALYVGRRDSVVSADGLLKTIFQAIDPAIPVILAAAL